MAQKWYPVIDYMACAECGVCVNFCPHHVYNKNKRRGFFGAFLVGILGGIFSSPCSTPVLIALLAIVAGASIVFVQKINTSGNYKTVAVVSKIIMGALILLIGFYMFWLAF